MSETNPYKFSKPFAGHLDSLSYHLIATCEPATTLDRYLVIRALVIRGQLDKATAALGTISGNSLLEEFIRKFLGLQIQIFERHHLAIAKIEMTALRDVLPQSDFLNAEYHFIFGLLHNWLNDYHFAIHHFRRSAEKYVEAGFSGCAAVANFNLCVDAIHLNNQDLYGEAFANLQSIAEASGHPSVKLFLYRMRGNRNLDLENFEDAAEDFAEALTICKELERYSDLGSLACSLSYIYLKLGRYDQYFSLTELVQPLTVKLSRLQKDTLRALQDLSRSEMITRDEAKELLAVWKHSAINDNTYPLLFDLLLARLARSEDYVLMRELARKGQRLSVKLQQSPQIVDLRYYEILALIKTGHYESAARLLAVFVSACHEAPSPRKLKKCDELRRMIDWSQAVAPLGAPASAEPEEQFLILDIDHHVLKTADGDIDISRNRSIEAAYRALIVATEPIPLADFFEEVYGSSFNPLLHEKRLNSLIDRMRKVVQRKDWIMRSDGAIKLNPRVAARISQSRLDPSHPDVRRTTILNLIRNSEVPVSIADIEHLYQCNRRTLQLDLKHLLSQNLIQAIGTTRNRSYVRA